MFSERMHLLYTSVIFERNGTNTINIQKLVFKFAAIEDDCKKVVEKNHELQNLQISHNLL